jgi:hypothetical protein
VAIFDHKRCSTLCDLIGKNHTEHGSRALHRLVGICDYQEEYDARAQEIGDAVERSTKAFRCTCNGALGKL